MTMRVRVGPYDVDLSGMPPLTMRDLREMRRAGITVSKLADPDNLDDQVGYVTYLLRKIEPRIDAELVWSLTPEQFRAVAEQLARATADAIGGADPFASGSTPSPPPTDGDLTRSDS